MYLSIKPLCSPDQVATREDESLSTLEKLVHSSSIIEISPQQQQGWAKAGHDLL